MSINVNTPSVTLSVTSASGRVALPDGAGPKNGLVIINTGANPVFLQTGDSTITAASDGTCICVHPNWPRVLEKNVKHTHLAGIATTGTNVIYVTPCSSDEYV
jgi:hypothetical protein